MKIGSNKKEFRVSWTNIWVQYTQCVLVVYYTEFDNIRTFQTIPVLVLIIRFKFPFKYSSLFYKIADSFQGVSYIYVLS